MAEQVKTKPIKRLPRDGNGNLSYESFTANGRLYHMVKPGDEIGMHKYKLYQQFSVVAGFGATFADIVNVLKEVKNDLGADKPLAQTRVDCILKIDSLTKRIIDASKQRFEKMYYLVSLFVYPDGASPYEWTQPAAEQMIADWEAENISERDWIFFCLILVNGLREIVKDLSEKAQKVTVESLAGTISEATEAGSL